MGILKLVDAEHDPAGRYTLCLTPILDLCPVQRRRPLRHQRLDSRPISHTALDTVESGIACPLRVPHGPSESGPVVVVPDAYHDPSLLARTREGAPRRPIWGRVAPGSHAARLDGLGEELVGQSGHEGLDLGHLHVCAGGAPVPTDDSSQGTQGTDSSS